MTLPPEAGTRLYNCQQEFPKGVWPASDTAIALRYHPYCRLHDFTRHQPRHVRAQPRLYVRKRFESVRLDERSSPAVSAASEGRRLLRRLLIRTAEGSRVHARSYPSWFDAAISCHAPTASTGSHSQSRKQRGQRLNESSLSKRLSCMQQSETYSPNSRTS